MEFFPIRAYDNYIEANMRLSMLEDEQIVCYIKDEYTLTIDPLLNIALGGMKLMVSANQFERAAEILDRADAIFLETISCPACGEPALEKISETIVFKSLKERLKSLFISGTAQQVKIYYRCKHCQSEFKQLPLQA